MNYSLVVGDLCMATIAFDIGRICVKTAGRETGRKAVILGFIDQNYVLITGAKLSGIRRRKTNLKHLEALDKKIDIKENASDDDVSKKLSQADLTNFFKEEYKFTV